MHNKFYKTASQTVFPLNVDSMKVCWAKLYLQAFFCCTKSKFYMLFEIWTNCIQLKTMLS